MNDKRIKIYQITKDKLENQLIYTLFIFAIPFLALLGYLNDKEDIVNAFKANKELICTSKDIMQKTGTLEHSFRKYLNSVYTFIWTLISVITWTLF